MKNRILIVIILAVLAAFVLTSCRSHCSRTKRYWRNNRCVNTRIDTNGYERQYLFVNNSIVILR